MNAELRRGVCPTLAEPMQTGDGLLVRLNPLDSGFSPKTLIGLCEAALRHGNGVVEVTARGSFQIRGLTAQSALELSRDVDALGIAVRTGVPVETGPLAGLDPEEIADPTPLAERIREDIVTVGLEQRLGPKVSVIVDGGGRADKDDVMADVRLMAVRVDGGVAWRLGVVGSAKFATPLCGDLTEDAACAAALAILAAVAALGREGRARDLSKDLLERAVFKDGRSTLPPSVLPDISPARGEITLSSAISPIAKAGEEASAAELPISPLAGEMSGRTEGGNVELGIRHDPLGEILPLTDSRFAMSVALPFGHIRADTLIDFISKAARLGAAEIRLAPRRALLLLCPSRASAEAVQHTARTTSFVVDAADPRRSIAACPGSPACASGHIPARAIAAEIAASMPRDLALDLHVSGCAKRCAKSGHDGPTLLGLPGGAGLVLEGLGDQPIAHVAKESAAAAIGRIAALIRTEKTPGEDTAACARRLGPARLAQEFRQAS